ncbi:UDP-3-O-(3-hydroxymyristoyl)glucosamine N-acyltransferase [Romeria aff. gracilis LEGE 07310]|uniref:UDP-3-O-acylglucosamine N-acyltransferase n=1 Tax=Vasconcelosia minhoensis LEGE 07310 TaxID=915328 RepID=A0A8J7ATC0_9CYAN|nr:UDP-3-O-(3-hydroxymyristoyl)glucosamine N-acyltransferase [Romeria gracilis]MBE9080130.1 UDP-3-O-(3-hydroxymyristoyl)glucosamine N-acyltransferase [Romeria aff. gracilis LEGE 07310]
MKFSNIVQKIEPEQSSLVAAADRDPEISGMAAVQEASAGTLSYVEGAKFAKYIETTAASALILPTDSALQAAAEQRGLAWLSARDPRLAFARAIALFYQPFQPPPGIHPSAVIHPTTQLGQQVSIGAHVVIQADVRIGDRVCIHPNVVIYPEAQIGARTILHANCAIHERAQIGADCVIHSGAAIGSEGFGFVPTAEGWEKMHQSGRTVLEDGVEVGCNTAIDRPAVGETWVGRNSKIDNLVHVGHGCQIGEAVVMAGQVGLAGGVTLGRRVILAGQVGLANQTEMGEGAIATSKTGVHGRVAAGEIVSGMPALAHQDYLKYSALRRRLPELLQSLRQIQKQLGLKK